MDREKNFISVVAYLHNSGGEIPAFLDYIVGELEQNFERSELIFVDDASEDSGASAIREYMGKKKCSPMTSIISMSSYHGLEASMLAGVDLAIGDFVYEFDSILPDYPRGLFMEAYHASLTGDDIVAASPEGKTELPAALFYRLYNSFCLSGQGAGLRRETFRVVSRRAINRVRALGKSVPYRKAMYRSCGLGYRTIIYKGGINGRKAYTREERGARRKLASDTLLMFTDVVQKVSMVLSILFLGLALCVGAYVVCVYFSANRPVEGWAPMMGFLSAGFSGVFILMTIMLKYMAVLLSVTFNRKRYLVSSIEKVNH